MPTKRRTFLKTVTLAGAATQAAAQTTAPAAAAPASQAASQVSPEIAFPRVFSGRRLTAIAFPLGGVCAGCISLGGRGQLRDWEIFNRPDRGNAPSYAFPAIWAQTGNRKPVARVLESRIQPPFEGSSGLGANNAPGLTRLTSATFTGEFPLARIDFSDAALPVKVSLEAFSPFIPHEPDESGLPVAILRYRVSNPGTTS
ncbi:MAG TPA: GH116 family glycosyl-hydrolase, partial [Bryobacteraceae bacterium]|nr:GH116 family glycosyl-hydrolase [Bryobacteraceae bacterium]